MGSREKQTVVILAEDRSWDLGDNWSGVFRPGSFPDQAEWWKDENEDVFNTIIIPYYKGWEGHELSDAKKIIDNIPGEITIGMMGHSGSFMGGYPISEIVKENMSRGSLVAMSEISNDMEPFERYRSPSEDTGWWEGYELSREERSFQLEEYKKEFFEEYEDYKEGKDSETISDFVKSLKGHKQGKVKEVMVGACRMADGKRLSYLAEETGIPVSGQSNTEWGTGAIEKIGNEPNERFFVKGKDSVGVQFTPDRDFHILQTTEDFEKDKYDSSQFSDRLGWRGGYDKKLESKDNPSGWAGFIEKPDKTWSKEISERRLRIDERHGTIEGDIRETIDVAQFRDYFNNEDDYKEFLSDLGYEGEVKYTQKHSQKYSPEASVMESFLADEGDFVNPAFEWEPETQQFGGRPEAPDIEMQDFYERDEFARSIENMSRSLGDLGADLGRSAESMQEGIMSSIMNLVNPEETDLFDEDMP